MGYLNLMNSRMKTNTIYFNIITENTIHVAYNHERITHGFAPTQSLIVSKSFVRILDCTNQTFYAN